MAKFTDLPEEESIEKVLIMGLPGTGKTTLAAKLAEKFNLIWLETENDRAAIKKLPRQWQENIDFINIPDSATVPMAADTLLQLFKVGKGSICRSHGKYACALCKKESKQFDDLDFNKLTSNDIVVVNTASQLSASILAHAMKGKPVDTKPERDDWGSLRKFTEWFGSQFQAATFNLVVITHAVESTMEDNKVKLVPLFGSAGQSASFAKNFDHVIYTDIVNRKHKAFSSSTYSSGILTKSRSDFEIEKLGEPSLIPIFEKTFKTIGAGNVDKNIGSSNNGVHSNVGSIAGNSNNSSDSSTLSEIKTAELSPAQRALANLKAQKGIK